MLTSRKVPRQGRLLLLRSTTKLGAGAIRQGNNNGLKRYLCSNGLRSSEVAGNPLSTTSWMKGATKNPFYILPGALLHIGATRSFYTPVVSQCDAAPHQSAETSTTISALALQPKRPARSLGQRVVKAFRMLVRAVQLTMSLTPLLLLYPILHRSRRRRQLTGNIKKDHYQVAVGGNTDQDDLDYFSEQYLRFCLSCVEWSGATVIKLMQWLSSRPDLVGQEFCSIFCKLQDDTTPHAWRHTQKALQEAYGDDWRDRIRIEKLIGSGCIGQVYKGYVKKEKASAPASSDSTNDDDECEIPVAIKVLHPSSDTSVMETDLDWMRLLARLLPLVSEPLAWLNPEGAVEEFGRMLTLQLDLRHEGRNLERFQRDFKDDETVLFPQLVLPEYTPTRRVLVETYMEGLPILEYARQYQLSNQHDSDNKERTLRQLCVNGIQAVCKMIFWHNFCHGDLHPGNVLVTPNGKQLILLDVGIVNEYTNANHELLVNVLTSFIRHDGRKAAEYMMTANDEDLKRNDSNPPSNGGVDHHVNLRSKEEVDGYLDTIDNIAQQAKSADYMMEHLGSYISQICEAAAEHHVLMNQSFVSAALAVKVQEGIVLGEKTQLYHRGDP
jgi:aarF domain-containing kinase